MQIEKTDILVLVTLRALVRLISRQSRVSTALAY